MPRPPCRIVTSHEPRPYDIVWGSEYGWGFVRHPEDDFRRARASSARRARMDLAGDPEFGEEPPVRGTLYFPDAEKEENYEGHVPALQEPLKARGAVEESMARVDDGITSAVPIGWQALLREDAPMLFPTLLALHRWDCTRFIYAQAYQLPRWICSSLTKLVEGHWRETMRRLRKESCQTIGVLETHPHVFGRILAAAARTDLETAIQKRRDLDAEELLHNLEVQLTRAATPKGMDSATRRFEAGLLEARRRYGPAERKFWDSIRKHGTELRRARETE